MATRATALSASHVEALKSVPIEFWGNKASLRHISDAWKLYMAHLDDMNRNQQFWSIKRRDLLTELLYKISIHLHYSFDKVHLQREVYWPLAHSKSEERQEIIQYRLLKILTGVVGIPIDVRSIAFDSTIREKDAEVKELLAQWLRSQMAQSGARSDDPNTLTMEAKPKRLGGGD